MTELHRALAQRMKARRAILKITQMQLAERADISFGYVGELEIGHKFPTPQVLERLARALETRPYRLLMSERDLAEAAETAGLEVAYAAAAELRSRLSKDMEELLGGGAKGEPGGGAEDPSYPRG